MSYETQLNVTRGVTPDVAARLPEIAAVIGRAVVERLRQHFYNLNEQRHRGAYGGGYYADAAEGTYLADDGGGNVAAEVSRVGIKMRLLGTAYLPGGILQPKRGKYLSIPATFDTIGKSPTDYGDLRLLFGRQKGTGQIGPIGLMGGEGGAKTKETGKQLRLTSTITRPGGRKKTLTSEGEVLFWLRLWVTQAPDPTVTPTTDELETAGAEAGMAYLQFLDKTVTIT